MPIGQYADWDACKADGKSDKYCGWLENHVGPKSKEAIYECSCGYIGFRPEAKEHIRSSKLDAIEGLDVIEHKMQKHETRIINTDIASSVAFESKKLTGMTYQGFIEQSMGYYKRKFATETIGMFYGIPRVEGGVKKIKGLLAYAGVSLNNRLYLPEELAKGHEMVLPLLLNHSSTAGAEAEVPLLPQKYQDNLNSGIDTKVGEVTLHWDPNMLTLSYEGIIDDEYFINEVNAGKMGVSLGMVYDANSPQVCNEQCYTMIKGAEFREVSLVYHPGFPIVTIESNEALLKQHATEAIAKEDQPAHPYLAENPIGSKEEDDECQSCGEKRSHPLHNMGEAQLQGPPNMQDMNNPFENKSTEPPKIDENNDEIEPNINVLNANIQENIKNDMSQTDKRRTAKEDAYSDTHAPADPGTVNPSGQLPAEGVPEDQCGNGMIWSASQEKCVPADTGSSTARGAPPTVKPISNGENHGNYNADRRTATRDNRRNLRSEEADEATRALDLAEKRIRAKELFNREKAADAQRIDLQTRIKNARESSQRKAIVSSVKPTNAPGQTKVDSYEALTLSAGQWLGKVIAEEETPMSKQWKINKETYLGDDQRMIQTLDSNYGHAYAPLLSKFGENKTSGTEAVTGPPSTAFMRIMSEQVLVLPGGKVVTPIRQFCETKVLPPGTNTAQFYDFGGVTFTPITEDGTTKVGESAPIIRAQQLTTTPQGTMVTIGYTQTETSPVDLIAALNRAYALESVNQEAISVLNTAYNTDSGSSGDATTVKAIGGGSKTGYWINGNTGNQITSDASGLSTLSFDGLKAGKGVIQDGGFDDSNLICYTTGKAIRDLQDDPNLDTYIGFSKPAIITEGVVERIAGINLVRTSANAATSQTGGTRSVLFVPGLAFALASGRDLTMEAQRRNELQSIYVTGTQRITGGVKNVEVTCRLSTL